MFLLSVGSSKDSTSSWPLSLCLFIADKVANALDNKKHEVANSVYNGIDVNDLEIDPETEIEDAEDPISDETTDSIEEN